MQIPFYAARLKIDRANQHINSLRKEIAAFLATEPAYIVTKYSIDKNYVEYEFVSTAEIPSHLSLIIGDAIHNLRVSLDLLAIDVVQANGGNLTGVYFPFSRNSADLDKMIRDKKFHRAAPAAVDLLKSFKPYPEGNASLRYVHDLDIMDKHKLLLPIAGQIHVPGGSGFGVPHTSRLSEIASSGKMLLEFALERGLVPDKRLPIIFELEFPWNAPLQHKELVATLDGLSSDFSAMVDAFEALLF